MTTGGRDYPPPCPNHVTPTTPTNGPTLDGSILYNGMPLLLSSIRTRPKSEPQGRFDHLRGTYSNYPYIQRTLEQSNCDYRLGHSPCPTAREEQQQEPPASPDFVMLIPVTPDASQDEDEAARMSLDLRQDQAWAEEPPLLASTARSRSPRSEEESLKAEEMARQEGERPDVDRGNTPPGQGCSTLGLPRLDLAETSQLEAQPSEAHQPDTRPSLTRPLETHQPDTGPSKSHESETHQPDSRPSESHEPESHPPSRIRSPKTRQAGARKPERQRSPRHHSKAAADGSRLASPLRRQMREGRSSPRSRPTSRHGSAMSDVSSVISDVSLTPRPHCWVDDVTVSSDESLTERDLSLQHDLDDLASVMSEDPFAAARGHHHGQSISQVGQHRVNSPTADKKRLAQMAKRAGSPVVKRDLSAGKAKAAGPGTLTGGVGAGGCPRSLKHSSGSGSKAGGGGIKSPVAEQELPVVRENVKGAEEEEEERVALPRFMCPSSESKSRQAAIKEWLAKTSFSTACRTLPLM